MSMTLRFRSSGVHIEEPDLLQQKDGREVPGGSSERHPEPYSDVQPQPQVSHLAQRGSFPG